MPFFLFIAMSLFQAHAEKIHYSNGGKDFEALYYSTNKTQAPGLLLVPDCLGITAAVEKQAQRFQRLGFHVLVADIYGRGIHPANEVEGAKIAATFKSDRKMLLDRVRRAFDELSKQPGVDRNRLAAIGYKFGGLAVVELGRSNENLKAVVAVQTSLDSPNSKSGHSFKAKLLTLQPASDPYIIKADVEAFLAEMQNSNVDYEFVTYKKMVDDKSFDRSTEFLSKALSMGSDSRIE